MITTLRNETPVARKWYRCDACEAWRDSGLSQADVTADQWLIIEAAMADNWKIRPKTKYRKCVYSDAGEIYTYRARLDMDNLVYLLDLFEE